MLLKVASSVVTVFVLGLILPMVLIPAVFCIGYSEVIEEIAKTMVILFLILNLPKFKWQIFITIMFGFLFGLSENILYLNNIFQIGNFSIFWQRFFTTIPMHIATSLIILFFGLFGKKFIFVGLLMSIVIHFLFNLLILNFK